MSYVQPTTIDTKSIGEANKAILNKIEDASKRLNDKISSLEEVTKNSYFDLAYYFITVGICFWFIYILLKDIYVTLKLYYLGKQDFQLYQNKSAENNVQIFMDDNEFETDEQSFNTDSFIKQNTEKNSMNIMSKLSNIIKFKQDNNINGGIFEYADVDTNNIDAKFDNYEYLPSKTKESSFLSSLVKKPKHYNILNNNMDSEFQY